MKYPMIVLCALALTSTALAQDAASTKGSTDVFTKVDTDADGKVTREEAANNASFEKNFAALDGNSDGVVTEREYQRNTMPQTKH